MDEVALALAFLARRSGQRAMPETRWAHLLSFEMGWMNPGQARAFVGRARTAGLLAVEGEALRLGFDPGGVEVPRGFRPRPDAVPVAAAQPVGGAGATSPDGFASWLDLVAKASGGDRTQVLAEVAALQERMGGLLTADAAILALASRRGLDVKLAAAEAAARLAVAHVTSPNRAAALAPAPEGSR